MKKTEYMRRTYRNKAITSLVGVEIALWIFAKQLFNYGSAMTVAYADEIEALEKSEDTECDLDFEEAPKEPLLLFLLKEKNK